MVSESPPHCVSLQVSVGKFDGKHPSLTCATSAGKIFFHTPHEKDTKEQVRFLNINRKISALACGALDTSHGRDVLIVGASTTILAYDVNENRDLFFKETPDGANSIVVGKLGGQAIPMAFVGGNCSIQGFDKDGGDVFWTVTGDNVSSMTFCDVDEDGDLELLVGSDDFEVRPRSPPCLRSPCDTKMWPVSSHLRRVFSRCGTPPSATLKCSRLLRTDPLLPRRGDHIREH